MAFHQDVPKQSLISFLYTLENFLSFKKRREKRKKKVEENRKEEKEKSMLGCFPQFLGGRVFCSYMPASRPGPCLNTYSHIWRLAEFL